jgi:hypothetical protein
METIAEDKRLEMQCSLEDTFPGHHIYRGIFTPHTAFKTRPLETRTVADGNRW